jgi:hypothetical protein
MQAAVLWLWMLRFCIFDFPPKKIVSWNPLLLGKNKVNNEDSAVWIGRVRSVWGSPFFVSILLYAILNKHSVSRPLPSFPGDSITYTPLHFLPLLNNLLYADLQSFYFIVSVTTTGLWHEKPASLENLEHLENFLSNKVYWTSWKIWS